MTSTPPFVGQERPDACAIACLRMVLAHQGRDVSEDEIVRLTDLQEGGLTPAEISRLARHFDLWAAEEQLDREDLLELVERGRFPIVGRSLGTEALMTKISASSPPSRRSMDAGRPPPTTTPAQEG